MKKLILISTIASAIAVNAKPGTYLALRALRNFAPSQSFATAAAASKVKPEGKKRGRKKANKAPKAVEFSPIAEEIVLPTEEISNLPLVAKIIQQEPAKKSQNNNEDSNSGNSGSSRFDKRTIAAISGTLAVSAIGNLIKSKEESDNLVTEANRKLEEAKQRFEADKLVAKSNLQLEANELVAASNRQLEAAKAAAQEKAARIAVMQEEAIKLVAKSNLQLEANKLVAASNRQLETAKAAAQEEAKRQMEAQLQAAANWRSRIADKIANDASSIGSGIKHYSQKSADFVKATPGAVKSGLSSSSSWINTNVGSWTSRIADKVANDASSIGNSAQYYSKKGVDAVKATPGAVISGLSSSASWIDTKTGGWTSRIADQVASDASNLGSGIKHYSQKGADVVKATPGAVRSGLYSGRNWLNNLRRPTTPVSTPENK